MIAASLKQQIADSPDILSPEQALMFTDRGTTPYDDGYMDTVQYLVPTPVQKMKALSGDPINQQ